MNTVVVKRLSDTAILPTYAHPGDAGADLYSNENVVISPGKRILVRTGISIAMPSNWVGLVHPRSGLAWSKGVTVANSPGTVDSGYRGEIMVNLINHGDVLVDIRRGDRIAQLVFQQVETAIFVETDFLDETTRGENGHGSTGGV